MPASPDPRSNPKAAGVLSRRVGSGSETPTSQPSPATAGPGGTLTGIAPDSSLLYFHQDGRSERTTYTYFRGEKANLYPIDESFQGDHLLLEHFTQGLMPLSPLLDRGHAIVAFGSCFAAHISTYLDGIGYHVASRHPSAGPISSMGDGIVNTHALRQQFEWAWENRQPSVPLWNGYDAAELGYDENARLATRQLFDRADAFIVTLGLSEVWYDEPTGEVFWRAVPRQHFDPSRHKFRVATHQETLENLRAIHRLIRQHRPGATLVLTLSPIPLKATFRSMPCLVADKASKAILRSALDEFCRAQSADRNLFYFPSYEIALFAFDHPYMEDRRHLHKHVLDLNMAVFERHFCSTGLTDVDLLGRFREARRLDRVVIESGHWAVPRTHPLPPHPALGPAGTRPSPTPAFPAPVPTPVPPPIHPASARESDLRAPSLSRTASGASPAPLRPCLEVASSDDAASARFRSEGTRTATGLFDCRTGDLGDDLQSLAVLAHVDRIDTFLDRDHLADAPAHTETACLFNAWFLNGDDHRRPSHHVIPVWHGFAGGPESLLGDWLPYIKQRARLDGPIGCRDPFTADFLAGAGIETYWSGCLTLFLGQQLGPDRSTDRDGVLLVDLPPQAEASLPADLVRRATRLTTEPDPSIAHDPLERMAHVGRLARRIARAELVVTRQLQAALVAAGFGTPVVALPNPAMRDARRQFSGFETFLPTVFLDRLDSGLRAIDWRNVPAARIPDELRRRHAGLLAHLRARQLAGNPPPQACALDDPDRARLVIANPTRLTPRGQLRLRLGDRVFERPILRTDTDTLEIALPGFAGLSKFRFRVEVRPEGRAEWVDCGPLRELAATAASPGGVVSEVAAFVSQLSQFLASSSIGQVDWTSEHDLQVTAYEPDGRASSPALAHHADPGATRLPLPDASFETLFNVASLERVEPRSLSTWIRELHRVASRNLWFAVEAQPGRDRHWWEERFRNAGFRRHPLTERLVPSDAPADEGPMLTLLFEKEESHAAAS